MSFNLERIDPFVDEKANVWMRMEHCGRYLWAADALGQEGASSVADLACGCGYGCALLSEAVEVVVGADRDPACIDAARSRYGSERTRFLVSDLDEADAGLPGAPFDAATCFETLEHVRHPERLLRLLRSLLVDRGLLFLSVPNDRFERFDENGRNKDPFHLHVFDRAQIESMLEDAGFCVCGRLGQDLCNRVVTASSEMRERDAGAPRHVDALSEALASQPMRLVSRLFAYPDAVAPDESYSRLFVCRRR